ncbi:hypothetical protein LOZ53_003127 [Ophidiomyces ophidiicola]|nr:hypothetical protein LOZ53_003127 [Ophidiomyces ophidiicola]
MPPTPRATHPILRRFWGSVHRYLRLFSLSYCRWSGVPYDNQIAQLPFGLILKWSDGTRLEEVLTMQVARNAGLPVPKVICYGEHPDCPHAPYSILMTRVPGKELGQVYDSLSDDDRTLIFTQLKSFLEAIRQWKSPWGDNRICSLIGSSIRSVRIPKHSAGPFESEAELNEYLIKPAWAGGFSSEAAYNDALNRAQQMEKLSPHRIVFTHGDLKHHNIMVKDGKITGFLDWESAGWYPEYWDFTTAFGITTKTFWWYDFVMRLGGNLYLEELECEYALFSLTSSSYYW